MENSKQVQQDNLSIYERVRSVPAEAKKAIEAGRLKGKSDINPMWRIKALTEVMALWKNTKPTMNFNAKAFQQDNPAGYAKYMERQRVQLETNLKNLNMLCLTVWQRTFDISAESCIFVGVEK